MALFPIALSSTLGQWGAYAVYMAIGIAFGAVLEIAGFGNSKKLAAQFYFKDMTVLKVMFTAIIVAMVLIFMASAVGLLDYNLVWVNHTYLWPGIVGGLIMGVGFIVGGFCPGTSIVSASTGKVDGIFFVLGTLFGIFMFGETVGLFDGFWNSSYMGRFTLPEWLGLSTGVVVLLVVLMALFMFWGSEQLERIFGGKSSTANSTWRYAAAAGLTMLAVGVLVLGQPTTSDRWNAIAPEREAQLASREVQIHPAELLDLSHDSALRVVMLDVRSESDYNVFHLRDAQHVPPETLLDLVPELQAQTANTVTVVMSNDEVAATEAWKLLVAESVPNVYILEGGVNNWLTLYGNDLEPRSTASSDTMRYRFAMASGAQHPAAAPDPHAYELEYESKVVLELKRGPIGSGCGS